MALFVEFKPLLGEIAKWLRIIAHKPVNVSTVILDKNPTIKPQAGDYTLVLSDDGSIIESTSGTDVNITIPLNTTTPFPVYAGITVIQGGVGRVTIAPDAGVTVLSADGALKTRTQYSSVSLVKKSENTWYAFGDLVVV